MAGRDPQDELVDEEIIVPRYYLDTRHYVRSNTIMGLLTVRDLLYASVLGIMGGFISSLVPFSLIMKAIYPFWGGSQLLSGHHLLWMTIAYGTTKKKSALIITPLLKGIIEFLLGDSLGAFIILINLFEGLCLVAGFALIEYIGEYKTKFGWAIAGGLGNLPQAPVFWAISGRFAVLHWSLAVIAFIFAFLSGCFISGYLGRIITISIKQSMGEIRLDTHSVEFHNFGNIMILSGLLPITGYIFGYILSLTGYSGFYLTIVHHIFSIFLLILFWINNDSINKKRGKSPFTLYFVVRIIFTMIYLISILFYYISLVTFNQGIEPLALVYSDIGFYSGVVGITFECIMWVFFTVYIWKDSRSFNRKIRYSSLILILVTFATAIVQILLHQTSIYHIILRMIASILSIVGFFITGSHLKRYKGDSY